MVTDISNLEHYKMKALLQVFRNCHALSLVHKIQTPQQKHVHVYLTMSQLQQQQKL